MGLFKRRNEKILTFDDVAGVFYTKVDSTWFPFRFSARENAMIGVGHQDKKNFSLDVDRYCVMSGMNVSEDDRLTEDDVSHDWIRITYYRDRGDDDNIVMKVVDENDKYAIPVTRAFLV